MAITITLIPWTWNILLHLDDSNLLDRAAEHVKAAFITYFKCPASTEFLGVIISRL